MIHAGRPRALQSRRRLCSDDNQILIPPETMA